MGILLDSFKTEAFYYLFWAKWTNAHFGRYTTKKSSYLSVFFPAFLQTAVIDKPIPALFAGTLQSAAIGGL